MSTPPTYLGAHPGGKAFTGFFASALASKLVAGVAALTIAALGITAIAVIDDDYLRTGRSAVHWPR
ncbi:MAG: hypothetical protein K2X44_11110, partial [Magnetospirillum sp.]|nr:hypothetical protein [Magnetospirillum sp.]